MTKPGPKPSLWGMSPKAAAEVAAIEADLVKLTSRSLHPLARRLPLPPPDEIAALKLKLKDGKWFGSLVWVDGQLLDGRIRLWLWHQLGHRFETIPQDCQDHIDEPQALSFYLSENIGKRLPDFGWSLWRKGVAASVFARSAHANLDDGGSHLTLYGWLEELCKVPKTYIANAIRLSHCINPDPFNSALAGEQGSPDFSYIATLPKRGLKKLGDQTLRIHQPGNKLAGQYQISLFLIDLDYPPTDPILFKELNAWRHSDAVLAVLCSGRDVLKNNAAESIRKKVCHRLPHQPNWSLEPPADVLDEFDLRFIARALQEVKSPQPQSTRCVELWRSIILFSFADGNFNSNLVYKETTEADHLKPLDKDECRLRVYERIMRAFCRRHRNRVFVPYVGSGISELCYEKEQITLTLLEKAARAAGAQLIHYGTENSYLGDEEKNYYKE